MIVYFLFQDRLLPVKIVFMCDPEILFILFITDCLIFDGQHIITELFLNRHLLPNRIMSELYYDRIVIIPIFLLPFILLLNGIITSWYYYRMFVIRNSTITKYIQYRMNYYWMTPLPISTITKVFHPRIVPIPNATITELRITELFYYGLLLPNVAHS